MPVMPGLAVGGVAGLVAGGPWGKTGGARASTGASARLRMVSFPSGQRAPVGALSTSEPETRGGFLARSIHGSTLRNTSPHAWGDLYREGIHRMNRNRKTERAPLDIFLNKYVAGV